MFMLRIDVHVLLYALDTTAPGSDLQTGSRRVSNLLRLGSPRHAYSVTHDRVIKIRICFDNALRPLRGGGNKFLVPHQVQSCKLLYILS